MRFRDLVIHRYFRVDLDEVWIVLQVNLDELITALEPISSLDEDA